MLFVLAFGALLMSAGCSAADESTSDQKAATTEVAPLGVFRSPQPASADTVAGTNRATNLTSKEDTLTASVVQTSRSTTPPASISEGKFVTVFTIQIGAFGDATNALTLMKRTKERFGDIPVLNRFEPRDRLYRVSIGLFETRERAIAFQQTLIKNHGSEFKDTWVSQISK